MAGQPAKDSDLCYDHLAPVVIAGQSIYHKDIVLEGLAVLDWVRPCKHGAVVCLLVLVNQTPPRRCKVWERVQQGIVGSIKSPPPWHPFPPLVLFVPIPPMENDLGDREHVTHREHEPFTVVAWKSMIKLRDPLRRVRVSITEPSMLSIVNPIENPFRPIQFPVVGRRGLHQGGFTIQWEVQIRMARTKGRDGNYQDKSPLRGHAVCVYALLQVFVLGTYIYCTRDTVPRRKCKGGFSAGIQPRFFLSWL